MIRFAHHICSLVVLGLMATNAMAQEPTANRSGMSDLRYFAEHCLDTAPSYASTVPTINAQRASSSVTLHQVVPLLELVEKDGTCICAAHFVDSQNHLSDVVQNLHYVVKDEARLNWVSAETDPTDIALDYDGIAASVRIGFRDTPTEGIIIIGTTIEREGSCPA